MTIIKTIQNLIGDYAHEEIDDDRTYFYVYNNKNKLINMCSFEEETKKFLEERENNYDNK